MSGDSDTSEFQELVERYINGSLNVEETEKLDDALKNHRALRNELRARIRVHGDLVRHFEVDDPAAAISPLRSTGTTDRPLKPIISGPWLGIAAIFLLFAGGISFLLRHTITDKGNPTIARVVTVRDASWSDGKKITSGESIGRGKRVLSSGMVELSLPSGIVLAIEAPARFELAEAGRMRLEEGELSANVPDGAEGFTVETPEGNVIDLGTRFGVSVMDGTVEAHVFDGEIEVQSEGHDTRRLRQSEAIDLGSRRILVSEEENFPMPSFPLGVEFANGGFESETSADTKGIPRQAGHWGGDQHAITEASDDIHPLDGSKMLQFLSARNTGTPETGQIASQLWQAVDISQFADEVNRGGVTARLQTFFNRVSDSINRETDRRFGIGVVAFRGAIPDAGEYWDRQGDPLSERLSQSGAELYSDDDPHSWEPVSCDFSIPPGTDFLLVQVFASEDIRNETVNEFAGHFADSATLRLTTRARPSRPIAKWKGNAGYWNDAAAWESGLVPDEHRDEIQIGGEGEVVINGKVSLKQSIQLATGHGSFGRLRVGSKGVLDKSGAGQMIVGYNEKGVAEVVVEGTLRTRGPVFIGRNNARSTVMLEGGSWESRDGLIRLAQYGNRGPDTEASLQIRKGGKLTADLVEMLHDHSYLEIEDGGIAEIDRLRVGGSDGEAQVIIRDAVLRVRDLEFGPVSSVITLVSPRGAIEIQGTWTEADLLSLPGSDWEFPSKVTTHTFERDGVTWSRVTLSNSDR